MTSLKTKIQNVSIFDENSLKEILQEFIEQSRLTQLDVAKICGINKSSINDYIKGKSLATPLVRREIYDELLEAIKEIPLVVRATKTIYKTLPCLNCNTPMKTTIDFRLCAVCNNKNRRNISDDPKFFTRGEDNSWEEVWKKGK